MEEKDYYQILGIDQKADKKLIKAAFRKLARKFHPDVNKKQNSAEKFKEIYEAYEILSDLEKRQEYDVIYERWHKEESFVSVKNFTYARDSGRYFEYDIDFDDEENQDKGFLNYILNMSYLNIIFRVMIFYALARFLYPLIFQK